MGSLSLRTRIQILERDGYRCVYCGATSAETRLQVDHVLPRAHGGSDNPLNLVTACFACNNGKRARLIQLPEHVTLGPLPAPALYEVSCLGSGVHRMVPTERTGSTTLMLTASHPTGPRPGCGAKVDYRIGGTVREAIWPVSSGFLRGWPLPDGAWDPECVKHHVRGFLPWAITQPQPDWYVGFYSCDEGHAWSCGHGVVAGWSEIADFRVSPIHRLPATGYLRAHGIPRDPDLRVIEYPNQAAQRAPMEPAWSWR